jgi:5-methyltetrahydrofolate--homocysteine methyltransferase
MEILNQIKSVLQEGDEATISGLTNTALSKGINSESILNEALIPGMEIIGEKFRKHEIFLPEVLLAARAMNAATEILKPHLVKDAVPKLGKIVIGTIQGDLHDLGKNLVGIMLKGAGYEVIDLGKDVSPEKFVDTAAKENAQIIGMSALLTTTMPAMKNVVDLLNERKLSGKIKTIIGGAPVTENFAREIGADGYAFDAGNSVVSVKSLLNQN